MTASKKQHVLFICTHNSARSQMGEGLLKAKAGDLKILQQCREQRKRRWPLSGNFVMKSVIG